MLSEISGFKIITVTNLESIKTLITTKAPIKSHINSIEISFVKETDLILIRSFTFKATNLITYTVTLKIKKPFKISNILRVKNFSTKIEVNYETKIIKSLTLKALSQ